MRKTFEQKPIYHIRIKGTLNEQWAEWFPGFVMSSRASGETVLSGPVVDQAALQGALANIHSLGLSLLLLVETECPCGSRNCPRRASCQACVEYHAANGGKPYCFREKTGWDQQLRRLTWAG